MIVGSFFIPIPSHRDKSVALRWRVQGPLLALPYRRRCSRLPTGWSN